LWAKKEQGAGFLGVSLGRVWKVESNVPDSFDDEGRASGGWKVDRKKQVVCVLKG